MNTKDDILSFSFISIYNKYSNYLCNARSVNSDTNMLLNQRFIRIVRSQRISLLHMLHLTSFHIDFNTMSRNSAVMFHAAAHSVTVSVFTVQTLRKRHTHRQNGFSILPAANAQL